VILAPHCSCQQFLWRIVHRRDLYCAAPKPHLQISRFDSRADLPDDDLSGWHSSRTNFPVAPHLTLAGLRRPLCSSLHTSTSPLQLPHCTDSLEPTYLVERRRPPSNRPCPPFALTSPRHCPRPNSPTRHCAAPPPTFSTHGCRHHRHIVPPVRWLL
jgi:hypothetical protein